MAANNAAKNKAIRQEALREQLSNGGHVQHVVDIARKLQEGHLVLESTHIAALKAAADIKLRLIGKYIPDLKSIEVSQDPENPIVELSNTDLSDAINSLTAKLNDIE
jgi:hypothetical protein